MEVSGADRETQQAADELARARDECAKLQSQLDESKPAGQAAADREKTRITGVLARTRDALDASTPTAGERALEPTLGEWLGPTTVGAASPALDGTFSPTQLDTETTHALIQRMTETLDDRSSAYVQRLHAESLHLKAAVELSKTEAESHRSELERQGAAHAAVRSELQYALERAESAELKLDAYEKSRADVEADIQAQLSRMSAVHKVELDGQQVTRLQAEVQHLTLQSMLAEEARDAAEREAMQHRALRGLAAAVAEQKRLQHAEAKRELEEVRSQYETAHLQAADELQAVRQQAQSDVKHLMSKHTAHIAQLTADFHAAGDSCETYSTTLENMQKRHTEAQDEAAATQAQHREELRSLQESLAVKEQQHRAAAAKLQAEHDRAIESIRGGVVAEQSQMAIQRRQDQKDFEARLSAAVVAHREEITVALSSAKDAHAKAWDSEASALEAAHAGAMEGLRTAYSAELDMARTEHAEQCEQLQRDKASLSAHSNEAQERLRSLQQLHDAEIARAEMLSIATAERLARENEAAACQRAQLSAAHTEEMTAKDLVLQKAQRDYSSAVKDLEMAKSALESLSKLMKKFLSDQEDVESSEFEGNQYESPMLEYDALTLKFTQLILGLQEQNDMYEADLLSTKAELEQVRAGLGAALAENHGQMHDPTKHARDMESKDAKIRDLESQLLHLQQENDSLRAQLSIAPSADAARVRLRLVQEQTGFGMEVSDSLHVTRLTDGGSAQQAGVPVPSKIVEAAGRSVSTKHQLMLALTNNLQGNSSIPPTTLVPFVFLTSPTEQEMPAAVASSGSEDVLSKLSRPLVDEIILLQEMHAKELAERDAAHEAALGQAQKNLAEKKRLHDKASADIVSLRQAHATLESEQSDMEAQHCEEIMTLKEEAEQNLKEARLRARVERESAVRSIEETAAAQAARLTETSEEASHRLETEKLRHAAAEGSLKEAHSASIAQHTERLRLLQVGYDQLDEDFLAASQSRDDAVEEVAQLKVKLAENARQTKEAERSVAREEKARGRAESAQLELQRLLEESVRRGGLAEEQLATERASALATKKECATMKEQLRILRLQQERLENEALEARILAERSTLEALNVKEQWQSTILTRVEAGLINWAFVSWAAFASMQREAARREKAAREVRQSMQQFHTQVATISSRIDSLASSPVSSGSEGSTVGQALGQYRIVSEGTPPASRSRNAAASRPSSITGDGD